MINQYLIMMAIGKLATFYNLQLRNGRVGSVNVAIKPSPCITKSGPILRNEIPSLNWSKLQLSIEYLHLIAEPICT